MALPSTPTERLSKAVFGQVHRLAVMVWIAESDGLVNPTELASGLGRAQSAVQAPIRDLVAAGMLLRLPVSAGRTFYERVNSAGWQFALELAASVQVETTAHT